MARKVPTIISIDIPEEYSKEYREAIGQSIIDYIRERAEKGTYLPAYSGKSKKSGKYTEQYVKSLDFKVSSKSKSKVTAKLSGDMLSAIEILKNKKGTLEIGYAKSSDQWGKADGNIRGTYGKQSPVTKGRDFLNISDKEKNKILSQFPIDEDFKLNEEILRLAREGQDKKLKQLEIESGGGAIIIKFAKDLYGK